MVSLGDLQVKIFADGADLADVAELSKNPLIRGFTTNPTLMRKANVRDYRRFALDALSIVSGRPISFEVFSDEFAEMERQALEIASWGDNVYVKIPVTNTRGEFSGPLIERLSASGVQVNVTAMMTASQVERVVGHLSDEASCFVSVFAGRVADTGRDPIPIMSKALGLLRSHPKIELIWASPRELLNIIAVVETALETTSPRVIDYSTEHRTDFLDIYLSGTCKFFLGDTSGIHTVPQALNVPVANANWIPLKFPMVGRLDLLIPKKLWSIEAKRFLTFREIVGSGIDEWIRSELYSEARIELVQNLPEEILALAREMNDRIDGTWVADSEDEELQERYRRLFPPGHNAHGSPSRIGAEFLRQNRELLE